VNEARDDPAVSAASEPPAGAGEADAGQWRRVHPLTPLLASWQVIAVGLVFLAQNAGERAISGEGLPVGGPRIGLFTGLLAAGVLAGLGVVVVGLAVLSWRMTRYRVTAEALELNKGVLFRQHRRARLDRLQAVDVVQPFVARMAGLARLTLEVAGSGDSKVRLSYLTERHAQELRNELLARAAGVRYETEHAPEAPESPVLEVLPGRLIGSLALSATPVATVLTAVGAVVSVLVTHEFFVLSALGPMLLGTGSVLWRRFNGGFDFRLSTSPDGLRLRHGLLERRAQTVPPGRVQAIGLHQTWLWRRPDWWRMRVNVAGYGAGGEESSNESVLLPVGTRAEVLRVLALVLPELGAAPGERPADLVSAALSGDGAEGGFTCSPRRARWLDPISWRRNGFRATDEVLMVRTGRLGRDLVLVPHARTQSVGLEQGPVLRRLGLVDFTLHSTPGPISPVVAHLDAADAARLLAEQAARARQARTLAPPERWMERVDGVPPVGDGVAGVEGLTGLP
jgi:putative membrane protein